MKKGMIKGSGIGRGAENVRSLFSEGITTIKRKAKERNRLITYDMVTDPEVIYFVDHAELIEGIV